MQRIGLVKQRNHWQEYRHNGRQYTFRGDLKPYQVPSGSRERALYTVSPPLQGLLPEVFRILQGHIQQQLEQRLHRASAKYWVSIVRVQNRRRNRHFEPSHNRLPRSAAS